MHHWILYITLNPKKHDKVDENTQKRSLNQDYLLIIISLVLLVKAPFKQG